MAKIILQATAIAVVVFILAAASLTLGRSFHPTNPPNEAHGAQNSEAKGQHGKEEKGLLDRTAEDPVAFFTLWLTLFTGVLAAFTMWMALSTKDLRDFAEEQARDMKAAIGESKRSADAAKEAADVAKQASDATAALERPYFFTLARIEGKVPKEGPFDAAATPVVRYDITNLGRVPGILRMLYATCYLQRGKFPERPAVESGKLRTAQNPIAAGQKGVEYPCEFEKPSSKQDWVDIVANEAVPVFIAIAVYEGPLDYTYVDTVSYKMDPFEGVFYPLGIQYHTEDQASRGRISKGATLTIPNIIWTQPAPAQPAK